MACFAGFRTASSPLVSLCIRLPAPDNMRGSHSICAARSQNQSIQSWWRKVRLIGLQSAKLREFGIQF